MLMQIHGDFGEYEETEPPLLRIDLILHASISLERRFPLPILAKWQRWVEKVNLELEPILPGGMRDGSVDMLAFRDVPEAVITFGSEGQIFLKQVSLKAW